MKHQFYSWLVGESDEFNKDKNREDYRIMEHTINCKAPCGYVADKEKRVLRDIESEFLNNCRNGCFITKIVEISNISMCRIINTNQDAIGAINVLFVALVKCYYPKDIISNIKVCTIEGRLCAKGDDSIVIFDSSANTKILSNDQIIPIVVDNKICNPYMPRINILGNILLPETETPMFKITGILDMRGESKNKNKHIFDKLLNSLKRQESDLKLPASKKFTQLLNSYENVKNTGIDLTLLFEKAATTPQDVTGYWAKNLKSPADSCLYTRTETLVDSGAIDIEMNIGFITMLKKCVSMRKGIIELGETYKDSAMYDQANSIWLLMGKNKLPE